MAEKTVEELKKELAEISQDYREFREKVKAALGEADNDTQAFAVTIQTPVGSGQCTPCIAWTKI